jgi:hypothetical protein
MFQTIARLFDFIGLWKSQKITQERVTSAVLTSLLMLSNPNACYQLGILGALDHFDYRPHRIKCHIRLPF